MNTMRNKYFVEVAKWGSFSKAAQVLYVSQPNLSRQIAMLEQEVGFELFHRRGKNIRLTCAGEHLYDQIKDIPDQIGRAIAEAEAISRREACSLSIGVLEGQDARAILSQYMDELREKNPRMTVELERNNFRNLRQGLDKGVYDSIVTMEFELEGHDDWDSRTLIRQAGAVVVSSYNPLADQKDLTLADFRDEPFVAISREVSPGGFNLLLKQCGECGFEPHIVRETVNNESLFLCVEMGVGVAILDRNTRFEHSDSVRVIPIPESHTADLKLAWRRDNHNPMLAKLIEMLDQPSK